jgi:hypothetical protein
MIFSCAVSFESEKKKIPDLSLPPCILLFLCPLQPVAVAKVLEGKGDIAVITTYRSHFWFTRANVLYILFVKYMRPLLLRLSSDFVGSSRRIKTDEPFLSLIAETGFLHVHFKFNKEHLR